MAAMPLPDNATSEFRHKLVFQCGVLDRFRCDHCEEEFPPEEFAVLPLADVGRELICARCVESMLLSAIAELPRES